MSRSLLIFLILNCASKLFAQFNYIYLYDKDENKPLYGVIVLDFETGDVVSVSNYEGYISLRPKNEKYYLYRFAYCDTLILYDGFLDSIGICKKSSKSNYKIIKDFEKKLALNKVKYGYREIILLVDTLKKDTVFQAMFIGELFQKGTTEYFSEYFDNLTLKYPIFRYSNAVYSIVKSKPNYESFYYDFFTTKKMDILYRKNVLKDYSVEKKKKLYGKLINSVHTNKFFIENFLEDSLKVSQIILTEADKSITELDDWTKTVFWGINKKLYQMETHSINLQFIKNKFENNILKYAYSESFFKHVFSGSSPISLYFSIYSEMDDAQNFYFKHSKWKKISISEVFVSEVGNYNYKSFNEQKPKGYIRLSNNEIDYFEKNIPLPYFVRKKILENE